MDYYAVLGVRRDASSHEIKAAYRRQAMKCHPDRVHAAAKGATRGAQDAAAARFRAIAEAYEVLGNEARRRAYNSRRHAGRQRAGHGGTWDSWRRQHSHAEWDAGRTDVIPSCLYHHPPTHVCLCAPCSLIVGGLVLGGTAGDYLWASANRGKSFEEAMARMGTRRPAPPVANADSADDAQDTGWGTSPP
ncbi:unnamed protein product [Closterium sp. Naga37s-1]|nr:unnamed protein product [Closterium sp. Naga37s-1]